MQFRMVQEGSESIVREWLVEFAEAIRTRDFKRGRALFADDVVGFGTVASRCDGLVELESRQWRHVWGVTSDFEFDLDHAVGYACGELATAACSWQSYGLREDGSKFLRRGRCTFIFTIRSDKCLAVHSHFSMVPAA
jgi:ketosteroid isomerase-like protein